MFSFNPEDSTLWCEVQYVLVKSQCVLEQNAEEAYSVHVACFTAGF